MALQLVGADDPARVRLVPVAGSPGSVRSRDGDHVRELARSAAGVLRRAGADPQLVAALRPGRRREDQVGLGPAARAANRRGVR